MIDARQIFEQPFTSAQWQGNDEWQRQTFKSDDDQSLLVSLYLDSNEGRAEVLRDVSDVLYAFGFTNFVRAEQAPGSWYVSIKVEFGKGGSEEAQHNKKQLKEALLSDKPRSSHTDAQRTSVRKLKKSLLARMKKGLAAITFGSVLLFGGHLVLDATKDAVKDVLKDAIKPEITMAIQKTDTFITKELPPAEATRFHNAVKHFIDTSPDKSNLAQPK